MAGFTGFSEAEIRRFKIQAENCGSEEKTTQEPIKKAAINSSEKRSKPREKIRKKSGNKRHLNAPSESTAIKTNVNAAELKQDDIFREKRMAEEKPREVEVVMEPEK